MKYRIQIEIPIHLFEQLPTDEDERELSVLEAIRRWLNDRNGTIPQSVIRKLSAKISEQTIEIARLEAENDNLQASLNMTRWELRKLEDEGENI